MARKRRKTNKAKKKQQKKDSKVLTRSASREIIGIILIMLAVFLVLGILNFAGALGQWTLYGTKFIIGQAVYLLPVAMLISAYLLFRTNEEENRGYKLNHFIGTVLFFIFLAALIQAVMNPINPPIAPNGLLNNLANIPAFCI